jgi:hypothetical protein
MSYNITYKNIFEIDILHNYFLNNGVDEFISMSEEEKKKMLRSYHYENFLRIVPTHETVKLLKNNHLIFNASNSKIKVGTRISGEDSSLPFSNISLDLNLVFTVKINDVYFENYTNIITTQNQILYLSNVKPSTEPISFKYIPLESENLLINQDYKITELSTKKIIEHLDPYEKNGLLGIISIAMKGDKTNLHVLTSDKKIISPTPKFKIHFDNRKTFWKYIKSNIGFEVETVTEKPLTQNGFVEIVPADFTTSPPEVSDFKYPNPSVKSIQKIATKTYSQIFI